MQDAITYNNLYLNLGNAIVKVFGMQIAEAVNSHGEATVVAIMEREFGQEVIDQNPVAMLIYYVDKEDKPQPLFAGIISAIQVEHQGDQYYLIITSKAATMLMDQNRVSRSYQDAEITNHELVQRVMKRFAYGQSKMNLPEQPMGNFYLQYEETDWEFVRRFASGYHTRVFPDNRDTVVRLQIGLPQVIKEVDWDELPYQIYQDLESYHYIEKNCGAQAQGWDCIRYCVNAYDIVHLGSKVIFKGREYYVGKIVRGLSDGLVTSRYTLYSERGLWMPKLYHSQMVGVSAMGIVRAVKRDRIQVDFIMDEEGWNHKFRWFPYSTMASFGGGDGWYAMPRQGEQVRVFFPDHDEEHGYAMTCMGGSVSGGNVVQQDWDTQCLEGPDGAEITFVSNGVVMRAGGAQVLLDNSGTLSFTNAAAIKMNAAESISIGAEQSVGVTANLDIRMVTGGGFISLTKGGMGITGSKIHLNPPKES